MMKGRYSSAPSQNYYYYYYYIGTYLSHHFDSVQEIYFWSNDVIYLVNLTQIDLQGKEPKCSQR